MEQAMRLGREHQGEGDGAADDLPELAYPAPIPAPAPAKITGNIAEILDQKAS